MARLTKDQVAKLRITPTNLADFQRACRMAIEIDGKTALQALGIYGARFCRSAATYSPQARANARRRVVQLKDYVFSETHERGRYRGQLRRKRPYTGPAAVALRQGKQPRLIPRGRMSESNWERARRVPRAGLLRKVWRIMGKSLARVENDNWSPQNYVLQKGTLVPELKRDVPAQWSPGVQLLRQGTNASVTLHNALTYATNAAPGIENVAGTNATRAMIGWYTRKLERRLKAAKVST